MACLFQCIFNCLQPDPFCSSVLIASFNLSDQCLETERVWLARPVTLGLFCRELEACSKVADTTKDSSEQPALASCHGQVSVSVCKKIEFTIQLLPYDNCLKTITYISDVSSKKYADHPCINDIGMLQLTDRLTVSRRKTSINLVPIPLLFSTRRKGCYILNRSTSKTDVPASKEETCFL